MPLTKEQRRENGRRGALKRWEGKSDEERSQAAQTMAAGRTDGSRLKRVRTEAARLGYTLVPSDEAQT